MRSELRRVLDGGKFTKGSLEVAIGDSGGSPEAIKDGRDFVIEDIPVIVLLKLSYFGDDGGIPTSDIDLELFIS